MVLSVCGLRRLESLAGVRGVRRPLPVFRVCVDIHVPARWLRGDWDLHRRRDWSLRRRGMFNDVFWRIAQTVLQFVLFVSNIY